MPTVSEFVSFLDLCRMCQNISNKKGKMKKTQPLKDFICRWRKSHNTFHASHPNTVTDSFYPVLRLLLPHWDRRTYACRINEFVLAKLLIEIFALDKYSADAQKLINYRSPNSAKAGADDFASVAYFVLQKRSPEKGDLTVHKVNSYLDEMASYSIDKEGVKENLLFLLKNTSALEQKWLIRMILKDMKLGICENTVLDSFHPDAQDLFNVSNSLEKVCTSLRDPSVPSHEVHITIFSPFRPMLAEIALPNQVEDLMQNKSFIIETKYDGERLQLHKKGNTYMYFSRGGHTTTLTYGYYPDQGILTPFIHPAFSTKISGCILDGELVMYNNKLNCIVSKEKNSDVQAMEPDGDYNLCFCVFDVLMFNGKVLSKDPLSERVKCMKKAFSQIDNRIRYTERKIASSNNEVVDELNKAIDLGLEGIIIKNPDSVYKPNKRKDSGWLKIKPEYNDNLMDELDLLIIGGYYAEGKRSTLISHFLLAVASDEQTNGEPACFYSFCKVGSGYSLKELYELSGKLEQHWQPYNPKKPPSILKIGGGKKERPDVWIEPSKSQIVQVKAVEMNHSKGFATKCTLCFPKIEKIRYDKSWFQCMTRTELEDLRNLVTKNVDESEEPSPKKQRIQRKVPVTVAPHSPHTDVRNVQKVSNVFEGKEFYIIITSIDKKQNVENLITQHGGTFVQNPGFETFCVLTDRVTAKVKNIMTCNKYDIANIKWFDRCIEKKMCLPWMPDDLFHITIDTQEKIGDDFDKYCDKLFTEEFYRKTDSFRNVFQRISENFSQRKISQYTAWS